MRRCLNPKNSHIHLIPSVFTPVSANVNDASKPSSEVEAGQSRSPSAQTQQEEQVTCQYCKYLLEGALLGDCQVTRWIGSGTFGDVYEAEQLPPLNRRVAIKVMAVEHVSEGGAAELFACEVRAIAALDHPNILPVLRVGSITDGRPYLVMKFAAHGSLQKFCPASTPPYSVLPTVIHEAPAQSTNSIPNPVNVTNTPLPDEGHNNKIEAHETLLIPDTETSVPGERKAASESETASPMTIEAKVLTPQQLLPYLEGAAAALQYAHDNGIIHLDVKPANLLLDGSDRLLLADFGVSALLEDFTHASIHGYVGTPLYTAPEQWLEQPRAASDQYALAVTCYQLLTGRAPFTGNLYSIMHGHIQTPPPSLREFQPLISEEVEAVILHALAKEPMSRYENIQSFALAYRTALESSASSQTDAHEQRYVTQALTREFASDVSRAEEQHDALPPVQPAQTPTVVTEQPTSQTESSNKVTQQISGQALAVPAQSAPEISKQESGLGLQALQAEKVHPRKRNPWRVSALVLLIILLIASSTLGIIWFTNPCLLGACPSMIINTHSVQLTDSSSQSVRITNTGTADLHWSVSRNSNATWLRLSPQSGTIAPGKIGSLTISSDASGLQNGTIEQTDVQVTGIALPTQTIAVTMHVLTGLNAVKIQASLKDFSLVQGMLQPPTENIKITNNSGQTISWLASFSENTWLVVTPNQNNALKNGKSDVLTVTANTQNLTQNTYVANLQLLGSISNQPGLVVLGSYAITLHVSLSPSSPTTTPISPVTPTATQQAFQFPSFSAQVAPSNGGPATLRSHHAMISDGHGNLLVFGGIDNQGNVLNDLWEYHTGTGSWTELSPPTTLSAPGNCGTVPAPRMDTAVVWDSVDQRLLLYGGMGTNSTMLGDLWSFDPTRSAWMLLQCSGNSPGPRSSNAVWDGQHMLLLGGKNASGLLKDFWSYTPGGTGWQQLADAPMGPRAYQTMVWNTNSNRLYVFGGLDANGLQQDDFWTYSSSNSWVRITPLSTGIGTGRPGGRQEALGAWDSKHNLMFLTGGWEAGQTIPYYGLWVYDPIQNAWGLVTPDYPGNGPNPGSHIIPGRIASAMIWDTSQQHLYIYAGSSSYLSRNNLNDLWMVN